MRTIQYICLSLIAASFILAAILLGMLLGGCGNPEDSGRYRLTVDGFKDNFTGYYKIDGSFVENFRGHEISTPSEVHPIYQYEINLGNFSSIKVFAFKNSELCSLTISI